MTTAERVLILGSAPDVVLALHQVDPGALAAIDAVWQAAARSYPAAA